MILFLQLLLVFFEIGLFGFGGGYAMLSLVQAQVVTQHHWLTVAEFTNMVALSQMTPGPIGINAATYCGYYAMLNAGHTQFVAVIASIATTAALMLPSLILMILIARTLLKYMHHPVVEGVFRWLRPAVVGLLAAAVLSLMNAENFSTPHVDKWQFVISVALFLITFVGILYYKVNPIKMIALAACVGVLLL